MIFPIFCSWWKAYREVQGPVNTTKTSSSPCQSCPRFHTSSPLLPTSAGLHRAPFQPQQHSRSQGPNLWFSVTSIPPPFFGCTILQKAKNKQWLDHFWLEPMTVLSKLCPIVFFGYQNRKHNEWGKQRKRRNNRKKKGRTKEAVTKVISFEPGSEIAVLPVG